jgi:rod shape determining protein RodA
LIKKLRAILLRLLTTRVAWPIVITITLLSVASLRALALSSPERAERQQIHILVGTLTLLLALLPNFQTIGRIAYAAFGIVILLLIGVLFAPAVQFTHRWFVLLGGVQLQPSEFAKLAFILAIAWLLRHRKNVRDIQGLILPFVLALIQFVLVLVEPDLGTALLFPLILYAMLIAAGARFRHLLVIALILPLAGWGYFPFLRDYQKDRLYSMGRRIFHVEAHAAADGSERDSDLQQNYSLLTIGSGGLSGQGAQGAAYIRQGVLPEAYTDFIFAIIGIQWGFLGCLLILVLYLAFFAAAVEIAASSRDNFGRLLVVGLASMILFQALINIAMTIALGPVVGIELPFLSYGGSSLLTNFLAAGLILNVSVRRNTRSAASR